MDTPNSMRILYSTSFLTGSQAFLKSMNNWCTVSLYAHFLSSIWRVQNIWPVRRWPSRIFWIRVPKTWSVRIFVSAPESRVLQTASISRHTLTTILMTMAEGPRAKEILKWAPELVWMMRRRIPDVQLVAKSLHRLSDSGYYYYSFLVFSWANF
jgi:hypothetical protein